MLRMAPRMLGLMYGKKKGGSREVCTRIYPCVLGLITAVLTKSRAGSDTILVPLAVSPRTSRCPADGSPCVFSSDMLTPPLDAPSGGPTGLAHTP